MVGTGGNPFHSKSRPPSGLTRERIEADMKRFEHAGGKIERLGNTPALRMKVKAASTAVKVVGESGSVAGTVVPKADAPAGPANGKEQRR